MGVPIFIVDCFGWVWGHFREEGRRCQKYRVRVHPKVLGNSMFDLVFSISEWKIKKQKKSLK